MAFETSLYAYLSSKTAITNLVTMLAPCAVPPGTAYPYFTFQILSKDRGPHYKLGGPSGKCTIHLVFDIESHLYSDTVAIAEAIRNECEGFKGVMSGTTIQRFLLDNENDQPQPPTDNSEQWVMCRVVEYVVDCLEPLPVPT